MIHNNICFEAYSYYVGSEHGNLNQSHLTISRVTYFILRAPMGKTRQSHQAREKEEREYLKMQLNEPNGKNKER